jgi:hypothetical protein
LKKNKKAPFPDLNLERVLQLWKNIEMRSIKTDGCRTSFPERWTTATTSLGLNAIWAHKKMV